MGFKRLWPALVWTVLAAMAGVGRADVVINEFLAVNSNTLTNRLGETSDWIELYNPTTNAVDLSGWYLSDNAQNLTKWRFPNGVGIPASGFRIVHASGHTQSWVQDELHAAFKLDAAGEYLGLIRPDGITVAHAYAPAFPVQKANISFGLRPSIRNVVLVPPGDSYRYRVPDGGEGAWTEPHFDDSAWLTGSGPLGYGEPAGDYAGLITTPLEGVPRAVYRRHVFEINHPETLDILTLRIKFDDGFVAYLNGVRVLLVNAPEPPDWNAYALLDRPNAEAMHDTDYNLSHALPLLLPGANVLAVHGLNRNEHPFVADMLLDVALDGEVFTPDVEAGWRYFHAPTPGRRNVLGSQDFSHPVRFSHPRGFHEEPFWLHLATDNPGDEIRYTLDGSVPTTNTGARFTAPLLIATSTVVRARTFLFGLEPSSVATHTYLFAQDIGKQPRMNTAVATHAEWGPQLPSAFQALPVLSLATDPDHLFSPATGIYANPLQRGVLWERPVSAEWFQHGREDGFALDCGVRIYGGWWRNGDKKSFRLLFKGIYGPTKLEFPLFDDPTAAADFDTIILRAGGNDKFTVNGLIDPFIRRNQLAMGQAGSRSAFVHLFLNGEYWGIYNPSERCDQAYGSSYFGVSKPEWDGINAGYPTGESQVDGYTNMIANVTAYSQTAEGLRRLEGLRADGSRDPALTVHLDVGNHIDYMLNHIWAGTGDWPHHNWYAGGARVNSTGWKFFTWDAEGSLGNLTQNITSTGGPINLHGRLRTNPEYLLRFADHVRRHLFGEGALTPERTVARYREMVDLIDRAVVADAARWGTSSTPSAWRQNQAVKLQTYLPQRTAVVLNQLRAAQFYPPLDAPEFSHPGGWIGDDFSLTIMASNAVYFTLNGTDPRTYGTGLPAGSLYGGPIPLNDSAHVKARARNSQGVWSALTEAIYISPQVQGLRLTELMHDPPGPGPGSLFTASDYEFMEFQNVGPRAIDVRLITLDRGVQFRFAPQTVPSGGYVVLARHAAAFAERYGSSIPIAGEYSGALDNSGERVVVRAAPNGPILIDFQYGNGRLWPLAAQGAGHSLVPLHGVAQADRSLDYPANWRASTFMGGSPGRADPPPLRDLVINEIIAHTDYHHPDRPEYDSNDWLELFNAGALPINGTDWYLSDRLSNLTQWPLPADLTIPPGAWKTFNEVDDFNAPHGSGFALNKSGETLVLSHLPGNGQNRIADAVRFKGVENGWSWGRYPDGVDAWFNLTPTSNSANALPGLRVVVSEFMYHPPLTDAHPVDNTADEFVELFNPGPDPVPLWTSAGPWRFWDGIKYSFPPGTVLAPGEHVLLVSFDPNLPAAMHAFWDAYGVVNPTARVFGPFENKLANGGERLALERPQLADGPDDSDSWVIVDEVVYSDRAPWPDNAAGLGASLQRIHWQGSGMDPENWTADFAPTPGQRRAKIGILRPRNDLTVLAPLTMTVDVTIDPEQIEGALERVELWAGGGLVDVRTQAPFIFDLPMDLDDVGARTLQAVVVDGAGAVTSGVTTVRVLAVDHAGGATRMTDSTARLFGHLHGPGHAEIEFFWGRSDGGTNPAAWEHSGSIGWREAGGFAVDVSGLHPGVAHVYRIRARHGAFSGWTPVSPVFTAATFDQWAHRLRLTIQGYQRPEVLEGFPLLVKLGLHIPGFTYQDMDPASGADLRFVDPMTGLALPYEVAVWNPAGESLIWVRLPRLSSAEDFVYMYWGHPYANQPPPTAQHGAAWGERFRSVWHFDTHFLDATVNRTQADDLNTLGIPGIVAGARRFDGVTSRVDTRIPKLWYGDNIQNMTIGMWVKPDTDSAGTVFGVDDTAPGERLWIRTARGRWNFAAREAEGSTIPVPPGVWQLLGMVFKDGVLTAYHNDSPGKVVGAYSPFTPLESPYLGTMRGSQSSFLGGIDEVHISETARPEAWFWAHYRNLTQPTQFVAFAWQAIDLFDDNQDGLPDAWQRHYFGSPQAALAGPGDDPDQDGLTNAEEFVAGTNPMDGTDYFHMRLVVEGPGSPTLQFNTVPAAGDAYAGQTRWYGVEVAPAMTGAWNLLPPAVPIPADGNPVHLSLETNAATFYRGRVWLQPEE